MTGLKVFLDWLTLNDYEEAKNRGTVNIVSRLSRGNILTQNGDVLTEGDLLRMSKKADKDMKRLEKATAA